MKSKLPPNWGPFCVRENAWNRRQFLVTTFIEVESTSIFSRDVDYTSVRSRDQNGRRFNVVVSSRPRNIESLIATSNRRIMTSEVNFRSAKYSLAKSSLIRYFT